MADVQRIFNFSKTSIDYLLPYLNNSGSWSDLYELDHSIKIFIDWLIDVGIAFDHHVTLTFVYFDFSVKACRSTSCSISLPSLVLIAEIVFFFERGHKDRQTYRQLSLYSRFGCRAFMYNYCMHNYFRCCLVCHCCIQHAAIIVGMPAIAACCMQSIAHETTS